VLDLTAAADFYAAVIVLFALIAWVVHGIKKLLKDRAKKVDLN